MCSDPFSVEYAEFSNTSLRDFTVKEFTWLVMVNFRTPDTLTPPLFLKKKTKLSRDFMTKIPPPQNNTNTESGYEIVSNLELFFHVKILLLYLFLCYRDSYVDRVHFDSLIDKNFIRHVYHYVGRWRL